MNRIFISYPVDPVILSGIHFQPSEDSLPQESPVRQSCNDQHHSETPEAVIECVLWLAFCVYRAEPEVCNIVWK